MINIAKTTLLIKENAFEVLELELHCEKCEVASFFMIISSHINVIIVVNCWMLLKTI
jgi:hypothetical protein